MTHTPPFLVVLSLALLSITAEAQNCNIVSGKRDRDKGVETFTGLVTSRDFYTLMAQKEVTYTDKTVAPRYSLYLHAASKAVLPDSLLHNTGTFTLTLLDKSTLTLKDVTYQNNPMGPCCSLGFKAPVSEETIFALALNPIVSLSVNELSLSTSFVPLKQKNQQDLFSCLLLKKARP